MKFSNCEFCVNFRENKWNTYKLFKNVFHDVLADGKGEINTAYHNYSKIIVFCYIYQLKG